MYVATLSEFSMEVHDTGQGVGNNLKGSKK
jgi:hypothetical protein